MRYITFIFLLFANQAFGQVLYPPFQTTVIDVDAWSWGALTPYQSRIPLLAAHDWSNDRDTLLELQAVWTTATTVEIEAVNCDPGGISSDEDRARITGALAANRIVVLKEEDDGGPQSPCYYDFTTPINAIVNRVAIIGQSPLTTWINYDAWVPDHQTRVNNAIVFGSEIGPNSGALIAYSGSLARGTTQLTVASGTWVVGDPVQIMSTQDGENVRYATFLTVVESLGAGSFRLTFNDPVPYDYGAGTIERLTNKSTDLVILNLGFNTPHLARRACARQIWGLGDCGFIEFHNRSRTVISNINMVKTARHGLRGRFSSNNVIKHSVLYENLALSGNGTQNGFVAANGYEEAGTDRIYDNFMRQGFGRLYGKPTSSGNNWYGFLGWDDDQTQIGDPITGYLNGSNIVHDTGTFYASQMISDDPVYGMGDQTGSERVWFYHDCEDAGVGGLSSPPYGNSAPNIFEMSELKGVITADGGCNALDNARYHTFFRLNGVDPASDISIGSPAVLPYSNWIGIKANSRTITTAAKENNLNLYNLYVSRDSNAGSGADYVSIGEETGSTALSSCPMNLPTSVVLRQDVPPCFWCAEFGNSTNNYGWSQSSYGACDSAGNTDLPAERRFKGLSCTPPPNCVDY